ERVGGLHVIVVVEQDRGPALGSRPLREHHRRSLGGVQLDGEPEVFQHLPDGAGGLVHAACLGGDRRDGQQAFQGGTGVRTNGSRQVHGGIVARGGARVDAARRAVRGRRGEAAGR